MSSIRHEVAPSTNTSPTRDSYTISSSSSPTRRECRPDRSGLPAGQEHAEQAAVGDRAAVADREPLAARPAAEPAGGPVPDQPRPQPGEVLARVAAGQHVQHRVEDRPGQAARTGPRAGRPAPARRPPSRPSRSSRRSAGRARRAGCAASAAARSARRASGVVTTAAWTRSPWYLGKKMPRDTSPTLCPARPVRCSPLATDGGDSTWMTRSTAPMSMPSSRLEVATTAGSLPAFSASSIWLRSCRDTEP